MNNNINDKLKELKQKLKLNIKTTPLFNSKLYTKNLEDLYKKIIV